MATITLAEGYYIRAAAVPVPLASTASCKVRSGAGHKAAATKRSVMAAVSYRAPTELELAFLRVVTRGFPELGEQIKSCELADYDPTGWCYVRATCGPPSPYANPADGPTLKTGDPDHPFVEIIVWTNDAGMLESVEIVDYGPGHSVDNPYQLFVDAEKNGRLEYREGVTPK